MIILAQEEWLEMCADELQHTGAVGGPAKRAPCPDELAELGGGIRVVLDFFFVKKKRKRKNKQMPVLYMLAA